MGQVGWPQLLIVLVIVLLVFGAKRLPEVGRSLGSGMREFKDGVKGLDDTDDTTVSQRQLTDGEDADTAGRS
ncbi:MAG TPA: twin-arginine translocase TatA/TatE family subunit [Miltoncostaeales bacterium]|jgi:sec-independent protein translocase protein TatA|nr:twin-arginine translocase TatA/TatE family subunit [Miltoncostaeales bacterium]